MVARLCMFFTTATLRASMTDVQNGTRFCLVCRIHTYILFARWLSPVWLPLFLGVAPHCTLRRYNASTKENRANTGWFLTRKQDQTNELAKPTQDTKPGHPPTFEPQLRSVCRQSNERYCPPPTPPLFGAFQLYLLLRFARSSNSFAV